MARITPHEVLKYLGFDIPEDGIDVNDFDMLLHARSLSLLGHTIKVEAISEKDLKSLRNSLQGLVSAVRPGQVAEDSLVNCDPESLLKLRLLLKPTTE